MTDRRVTAAIVLKDRRVLVARRAQGQKNAGMWEFPGGKVESGESGPQALVRECCEELGVTIRVHGAFMDVTHEYPELTVHLTLYEAEIAQGEPKKLEHNDIRWITVKEMDELEFCPADQVFCREIAKRYRA